MPANGRYISERRNRAQRMNDDATDDRLITIDQFAGMIGMTRQWYYKHREDDGMPQRIYVGGRPKLSLLECRAYVEALKRLRPQPKRKRGRPRKTAAQVAELVRGGAAG